MQWQTDNKKDNRWSLVGYLQLQIAQSAGAEEYTDCTSAEG